MPVEDDGLSSRDGECISSIGCCDYEIVIWKGIYRRQLGLRTDENIHVQADFK